MPKKGLITKREVRLLSLASMRIRPDAVGVGYRRWIRDRYRSKPRCWRRSGRVYAVEVDPEGVEICHENSAHACDRQRAGDRGPRPRGALSDLETRMRCSSVAARAAWTRSLTWRSNGWPGGRLVVNAITLENSGGVYGALRRRGIVPEVMLLQISRANPWRVTCASRRSIQSRSSPPKKPAAGGKAE